MKKRVLPWIVFLMVGVVGCTKNEPSISESIERYGEDPVYRSGDSVLYLCRHEWHGIVLESAEPEAIVEHLPWRVPTKEEGIILHKFYIEMETKQRYLCQDSTGTYYTFRFGEGNVTKAGQKTAYTLRPVRLETREPDVNINF